MEDSPTLLEVGMYVYMGRNWGGQVRIKIERVTAKQAFSGSNKFERQITNRSYHFDKNQLGVRRIGVRRIGEYGVAYLETPKLLREWNRQKRLAKARALHTEFKINEINDETAEKIIHFYESLKPELIDNNTSS